MAARAPLAGIKVVELAGLAPVPFVGKMLRDLGAEVVRVCRPGPPEYPDVLAAGKRSVALDLKAPEGQALLHAMLGDADVLLDPNRPGVLGKMLGVGSLSALASRFPRLVLASVTGYGSQLAGDGRRPSPYADCSGHDLNYLAVSGVLSELYDRQAASGGGSAARPVPPSNVLADFAAGSALTTAGILAALVQRSVTGKGGVYVDGSMADGTAYLSSLMLLMQGGGMWGAPWAAFLQPGGAPYYDTYQTADGRYLAVACIEPRFFELAMRGLSIEPHELAGSSGSGAASWAALQNNAAVWGPLRATITARIRAQPLAHWATNVFSPAGPLADACVTPVLTTAEAQALREGSPLEEVLRPASTPVVVVAAPPSPVLWSMEAGGGRLGGAQPTAAQRSVKAGLVDPAAHSLEVLSAYATPEALQDLVARGIVHVPKPKGGKGKPTPEMH